MFCAKRYNPCWSSLKKSDSQDAFSVSEILISAEGPCGGLRNTWFTDKAFSTKTSEPSLASAEGVECKYLWEGEAPTES